MSVVLGIDVSSHAIDLVRIDENTGEAVWDRCKLHGRTGFDRLRNVGRAMPRWASGWYDAVLLAAIETPKTGFLKSAGTLFPVYGAVVACLPPTSTLEVWDVHPLHWRHGIDLPGNASKAQVAARVRELYPPADEWQWPQDACDAYAVARYALTTHQRGIEAALQEGTAA